MKTEKTPPRPGVALILTLLLAAGCGAGAGASEGTGDDGPGGAGGTAAPGAEPDGSGGGGGTAGGGDGGEGPPVPGEGLVFRSLERVVLLDTAAPEAARCGDGGGLDAGRRRLTVDLDACALGGELPAGTAGLVGSITVRSAAAGEVEVRVAASGAVSGAAPIVVGPLQSETQGFLVPLAADRTFAVEVSGAEAADVVVELAAVLVPEREGGDHVHLLRQPLRWFAANPNDDGFRDVWPRLETVLRYPVAGLAEGATGMLGGVHLGPGVWREAPVTFHAGPAAPAAAGRELPRWASAPADAHFPWRYSSFFFTGASAAGEVELRSSSRDLPPWEIGIEPWIDVTAFLSPREGLVFRPLDRPVVFAPTVSGNEEDVWFESGLAGVEGVAGTIVFELPHWPYDERYRWFFVMVGASPDLFPGALGGGLEGPDWMTAGLNQNGRTSIRFVTRTDDEARFVLRLHAYLSGGPGPGSPSDFLVTSHVRVDGVFTAP